MPSRPTAQQQQVLADAAAAHSAVPAAVASPGLLAELDAKRYELADAKCYELADAMGVLEDLGKALQEVESRTMDEDDS